MHCDSYLWEDSKLTYSKKLPVAFVATQEDTEVCRPTSTDSCTLEALGAGGSMIVTY
jgi:hypothetical protein